MEIINTDKLPIYSWCSDLEESALKQAMDLTELPFAFDRLCLMPDCHTGYGMPIGGVLATHNAIIPNAVGVDIGCGVQAQKLHLKDDFPLSTSMIKDFLSEVRKRIPLGMSRQKEPQEWIGFCTSLVPDIEFVKNHVERARKQMCTLGGGNHFIELQLGSDGYYYIMIHSGSRNLGYSIAKHYNKLATEQCTAWHSNIPKIKGEDGLAFFPADSDLGEEYIAAMRYAKLFGEANREQMMRACGRSLTAGGLPFLTNELLDVPHNYADIEHHFGRDVWIHRKGAVRARKGEKVIIPGSQGTSSFIAVGKGNIQSFQSCSHGAGRVMSRTRAKAMLNLEEEQRKLNDLGIIHSVRYKSDLEEASAAYKDINVVMEEQKDLIEIEVELKPLAVIKG